MFHYCEIYFGPIKFWDHGLKLINILFYFFISDACNRFNFNVGRHLMSEYLIDKVFIETLSWLLLLEQFDLLVSLSSLVGQLKILIARPKDNEILIVCVKDLHRIMKRRNVYQSILNLLIILIDIFLIHIIVLELFLWHIYIFIFSKVSHVMSELFNHFFVVWIFDFIKVLNCCTGWIIRITESEILIIFIGKFFLFEIDTVLIKVISKQLLYLVCSILRCKFLKLGWPTIRIFLSVFLCINGFP